MTVPASSRYGPRGTVAVPPRWHVVARVGSGDTYTPSVGPRDRILPLTFDGAGAARTGAGSTGASPGADAAGSVVAHTAWALLDRHRLTPTPAAVDLFRAAAAVYAADARVRRRKAFDGWTRELVLHLPVAAPEFWGGSVAPLTGFLRFLTGDHWTVQIRPLDPSLAGASGVGRPPVDGRAWARAADLRADTVCLLSGGLDSFAGAVDALAEAAEVGGRVAFVSHNTAGSERFTSRSQEDVVAALGAAFGRDAFDHLKFRVVPPPAARGEEEDTQRSRSIIFLALGTLVAASIATPSAPAPEGGAAPAPVRLVVPENGFISLNVPLTPSRLGTCSTRTTHPFAMGEFARVLSALGLPVRLDLPYQWKTKGEMLAGSRRRDVITAHARQTNSCARPNDRNADPARPQRHCGYCVPCLIRRAAMAVVELDEPDHYRFDVHAERALLEASASRRSDVRAFEMALLGAGRRGAGMLEVLTSGPIPDDPAALADYVGVYRRGLEEVANFLGGWPAVG
jgi:hypothetical protein